MGCSKKNKERINFADFMNDGIVVKTARSHHKQPRFDPTKERNVFLLLATKLAFAGNEADGT